MCLLANTPFRLLQFEAISTRNGVAYPKKQSKYDSLLGVFVAVGIQASESRRSNFVPILLVSHDFPGFLTTGHKSQGNRFVIYRIEGDPGIDDSVDLLAR